jgi:hypothetical protein
VEERVAAGHGREAASHLRLPRRHRGASPVWHLDYSFDFDRPTPPVFDSIGDMVTFWIELIDDGQISWDAEGDEPIRQPVPDAILRRMTGVPTD